MRWYIRYYYKDDNKKDGMQEFRTDTIIGLKTLRGVKNRLNKYMIKNNIEDFKLRKLELCQVNIYLEGADGKDKLVESIAIN